MIVSYWLYGSWQLSTDISEFDFDFLEDINAIDEAVIDSQTQRNTTSDRTQDKYSYGHKPNTKRLHTQKDTNEIEH